MAKNGYTLCIDQASNQAGASLWLDNSLVATKALTVPEKSWGYARRVQFLANALTEWLVAELGSKSKVTTVIFEGVRSRHVLVTVGAFLTSPMIDAHLFKHSFVESFQWKSYAQKRGATGPFLKIKGLKALSEIGWPQDLIPETDDEADSIIQYLTYQELNKDEK